MRIAILADIHGNLRALDAVVEDIEGRGVDEVIVGGDLVGRGPQGAGVVDRVRELGWPSVRGNHEDYMIAFAREEVDPDWLVSDHWAASRWMAGELGAERVDYLDGLPMELRAERAPELRVVHGTQDSNLEGVYAWTDQGRLDELVSDADTAVLACAHTHRPLTFARPGGLIANVGSVGLPFNADWRAQYAVFERDAEGDWDVEFRQVGYDRQRFLDDYEETGFLAAGGVTSALLYKEVEHARPFLVPFLKWAEVTSVEPTRERMEAFLEVFDPTLSMKELWAQLQALRPS
jgi:predicted phosphodiesterase